MGDPLFVGGSKASAPCSSCQGGRGASARPIATWRELRPALPSATAPSPNRKGLEHLLLKRIQRLRSASAAIAGGKTASLGRSNTRLASQDAGFGYAFRQGVTCRGIHISFSPRAARHSRRLSPYFRRSTRPAWPRYGCAARLPTTHPLFAARISRKPPPKPNEN